METLLYIVHAAIIVLCFAPVVSAMRTGANARRSPVRRTPILAVAALCGGLAAPAAATDPFIDGISAAKCRTLPTLDERMACYRWVADVAETEARWEQERKAEADAAGDKGDQP